MNESTRKETELRLGVTRYRRGARVEFQRDDDEKGDGIVLSDVGEKGIYLVPYKWYEYATLFPRTAVFPCKTGRR